MSKFETRDWDKSLYAWTVADPIPFKKRIVHNSSSRAVTWERLKGATTPHVSVDTAAERVLLYAVLVLVLLGVVGLSMYVQTHTSVV